MFIAEVEFRIPRGSNAAAAAKALQNLLAAWCKNGQVLDFGRLSVTPGGALLAFVTLPEKSALDGKNANDWVKKALIKLAAHGDAAPSVAIKGSDIEGQRTCICEESSARVLYTNFLSEVSPVKCLDCFGSVPLYGLPPLDEEGYYGLRNWSADYRACDTLQMNCETGERFAIGEMSGVDSSLSLRGRAICEQIEAATGIPTYYYLYRGEHSEGGSEDGERSLANERKRSCPSCKGDWLLPEPIPPVFDFRCEPCRLLSNIAFSFRD